MTVQFLLFFEGATAYYHFLSLCLKRPLSSDDLYQIGRLYSDLDDTVLWEIAGSNKVQSVVAEALQLAYVIAPVHWEKAFIAASRQMSSYLVMLDCVASQLVNNKIPAIVLENGAMARTIYPHPGLYAFGDFDLLVSEEGLSEVHRGVSDLGYSFVSQSDGRIEYCRLLEDAGNLRLNFQTGLVARRWMYAGEEPDFETLLSRSKAVLDSAVRILGPEDFLYQVCIHNASHAYVRKPGIRLHLDVDWYLKQVEVDWPSFINMVNRFDVATKVYFSLLIPKALFETPVPEAALAQLRPPAWKEKTITRLINKAGLFDPHEKKFTRLEYILFNMLLYDDWRGLWRGVFPDKAWMQERYEIRHGWQLPYFHVKRMGSLLFRRLAT